MAWIESHQALAQHPKTKKFARLLGESVPAAIGHLHLLWWWALDFAQDGNIGRFDAEDVADAMLWGSDPQQLIKALVSSGFADLGQSGLVIHDWAEYAGRLIGKREKDKARKRALAGGSNGIPAEFQRNSNGIPTEVQRNSNGSREDSARNQPTNQPKPTNQPTEYSENADAKRRTDTAKTFTKPTVDEIRAYCTERGNSVDAQRFFDFYEAKGWRVGNQSMKDWKACVRTWEAREKAEKGESKPLGTFDTDDFFKRALARTEATLGKRD